LSEALSGGSTIRLAPCVRVAGRFFSRDAEPFILRDWAGIRQTTVNVAKTPGVFDSALSSTAGLLSRSRHTEAEQASYRTLHGEAQPSAGGPQWRM